MIRKKKVSTQGLKRCNPDVPIPKQPKPVMKFETLHKSIYYSNIQCIHEILVIRRYFFLKILFDHISRDPKL